MAVNLGLVLAIYCVEILKYGLAYQVGFGGRIWKWKWIAAGAMCVLLTGIPHMGPRDMRIIAYFCAVAIEFLCMSERLRNRLANIFVIAFFLMCTDEVFAIFVEWLIPQWESNVTLSHMVNLFGNSLTLLVVIFMATLKQFGSMRFTDYNRTKRIGKGILFILGIAGIILVVTITTLRIVIVDVVVEGRIYQIGMPICALSYLSISVFAVLMLYIQKSNERILMALNQEQYLKKMQEDYYNGLLEREEETRRYRHDMLNHLLCMESLSEQQDYDSLRAYIKENLGSLKSIQKKKYNLQHPVLDALTGYYIGMLPDTISVQVSGHMAEHVGVSDAELSILYGNLLKNAVEELQKCGEQEAGWLEIWLHSGRGYQHISIKNSLSKASQTEGVDLSRTSKADQQNHGYGLKNVKSTIERLGGIQQVEQETDKIEISVSIPYEG